MELPEPGAMIYHPLPDGGILTMQHDAVYINCANGDEAVCWVDDEWKEDISAVYATLNAISLALAFGAEAVRIRSGS